MPVLRKRKCIGIRRSRPQQTSLEEAVVLLYRNSFFKTALPSLDLDGDGKPEVYGSYPMIKEDGWRKICDQQQRPAGSNENDLKQ